MTAIDKLKSNILKNPKVWLVTGVAGFIGSNLLEALLSLNQKVVGVDNFSTGYQKNLDEVKSLVTDLQWKNFYLIEGDLCDPDVCNLAMNWQPNFKENQNEMKLESEDVEYVLHQAALGSVTRSIEDPIKTNQNNVEGFLNVLVAAKNAKVRNFVYASSSSTYGDDPDLPKVEEKIGAPLSPYAITKLINELYADGFYKNYGFKSIGLRYFNVFGKRQDPNGAYAAVIPKWIAAMIGNREVDINGDGETSRDFCFISNAVQANLLAALSEFENLDSMVFNVAVGNRTSLNDLFKIIKRCLEVIGIEYDMDPKYCSFREGDIRHSLADISKAKVCLGYQPTHDIAAGMSESIEWYKSLNSD